MVKPDTHNPPAAVRSSARHPFPAFFQQSKTTICPGPRLPAHGDDDGIAPEAEHQPRPLRLQVHDHARLVLQPEIARTRRADRKAVARLAIGIRKLCEVAEIVDLTRGSPVDCHSGKKAETRGPSWYHSGLLHRVDALVAGRANARHLLG